MNGLTTVSSEEPYVNSTSTVLWEVPGGNPGLPTRLEFPLEPPVRLIFFIE